LRRQKKVGRRQSIKRAKKGELENWQKVLGLANKNNWNEIAKIIQTIQR